MHVQECGIRLEDLTKEQMIDVVREQSDIIYRLVNERDLYREQVHSIKENIGRNRSSDVFYRLKDGECLANIRMILYGN